MCDELSDTSKARQHADIAHIEAVKLILLVKESKRSAYLFAKKNQNPMRAHFYTSIPFTWK